MKILITGGTGLVGSRLAEMLLDAGHDVALLSRQPGEGGRVRSFGWNPAKGTIDEAAVPFAEAIVNLAGSNVGEGRWTSERKRDILASRLDGLALLHRELAKPGHCVHTLVSASAVGRYGDAGDAVLSETAPLGPPDDFLAQVVRQWEEAAAPIAALGLRVVLPRIGVVLALEGGALQQMARPVKLGAGAALGSGKQWISWIHRDDLCRLLLAMLEQPAWAGPYNAVATYPATNEAFTEVLAAALHRPLLLPHVPAFGLRLALGEMSAIVLASQRVSNAKALAQGFAFDYPDLKAALAAIYVQG